MRLTGWFLLLIGVVLCATVAWAPIGFLLMGIGLISLQVAERARRGTDFALAGPPGLELAFNSPGLQPPTFEPVVEAPQAEPPPPPPRQPRRVAWPAKADNATYDREAWRRLIESDADLAQLATLLAGYGPQYVDELAISYLAAPDKNRLGSIVDGIIARARTGQPTAPPAPSRPPPIPRSEPQAAIKPPDIRPGALRSTASANPADAIEASLHAAVERGLLKAPGHVDPPSPRESRRSTLTRREPAFASAPKEISPAPPPPPQLDPPIDLEASLMAAVAETSANRAEAPKPAQQEPEVSSPPTELKIDRAEPVPPDADDLEASLKAAVAEASANRAEPPQPAPAIEQPSAVKPRAPRSVRPPPLPSSATADLEASLLAVVTEASAKRVETPPLPPPPAPVVVAPEAIVISEPEAPKPPPPPPPASAAEEVDESLLAALAEISGEKLPAAADDAKPDAPKESSPAPSDDDLNEMIRKFAPDSSFLSKP